jgi:hypothetical protein
VQAVCWFVETSRDKSPRKQVNALQAELGAAPVPPLRVVAAQVRERGRGGGRRRKKERKREREREERERGETE